MQIIDADGHVNDSPIRRRSPSRRRQVTVLNFSRCSIIYRSTIYARKGIVSHWKIPARRNGALPRPDQDIIQHPLSDLSAAPSATLSPSIGRLPLAALTTPGSAALEMHNGR